MYEIITVGSATFDVLAKTNFSELIKIIDPKGETDLLAFPSGAKILINELEFSTGGGGTNAAVALSRLGHRVAFLGKLGEGTNSEFIHKSLVKERIKLLCSHGKGMAGYSMILETLEHDRTILAYKGINDDFHNEEVPYKKLRTRWFYFSSMMNESFRTLEKLAEFAQKNKIKIVFNPSLYLAEKGSSFLSGILSRTEILILNREEAVLLVGNTNTEEMLKRLQGLGPKAAVITDGKNDLFIGDGRNIYSAKPPEVKVVDATGAGDAFAASFLSGIIKKNDTEFAIKLGLVNARSKLSGYGAKSMLLKYKDAVSLIKKLNVKINKKKIYS